MCYSFWQWKNNKETSKVKSREEDYRSKNGVKDLETSNNKGSSYETAKLLLPSLKVFFGSYSTFISH